MTTQSDPIKTFVWLNGSVVGWQCGANYTRALAN